MNDIFVSISNRGGLTINFDRNAEIDFILSEAISIISAINTVICDDDEVLKFNKYAESVYGECCSYNVDSSMVNFLMTKVRIIHQFQAEVVAMNPPTLYLFFHSGKNGKNPLYLLKTAIDMIIELSYDKNDFQLTKDFRNELEEINSDFFKLIKNDEEE